MYYVAINRDDVAFITTGRKYAAKWVGISDRTLLRHLLVRGRYHGKKGSVYATDFVKKQVRGFSLRKTKKLK